MKSDDDLKMPPLAAWLMLLPLAIMLVDGLMDWAFGWHDWIGDINPEPENQRLEPMGRSRVLAALLPFMLVASLIAMNFGREFTSLFGAGARKELAKPILMFGVAALLVIATQAAGIARPEDVVGSNFIEDAFRNRATRAGMPLTTMLDVLIWIFRIFLTLGAGTVIVGTISCLATPAETLSAKKQAYYRELQRGRLDAHLYASALLLVTGLFFIDACMRWPAAFAANPPAYMEHVNTLMLAEGLFYSSIIASYYIPTALLTQRFSAAGFPPAATETESDFSLARLIKAFLALVSPAIAGLLTQVLEGAGL